MDQKSLLSRASFCKNPCPVRNAKPGVLLYTGCPVCLASLENNKQTVKQMRGKFLIHSYTLWSINKKWIPTHGLSDAGLSGPSVFMGLCVFFFNVFSRMVGLSSCGKLLQLNQNPLAEATRFGLKYPDHLHMPSRYAITYYICRHGTGTTSRKAWLIPPTDFTGLPVISPNMLKACTNGKFDGCGVVLTAVPAARFVTIITTACRYESGF